MENISKTLDDILSNVQLLIELNSQLQKDNFALRQANAQLKAKQEDQQLRIKQLEGKLIQANSDIQGGSDSLTRKNKRLKKQIDKYIKEIDNCIEWLYNN